MIIIKLKQQDFILELFQMRAEILTKRHTNIPSFKNKDFKSPIKPCQNEILDPTIQTPHGSNSFYSSHRQLIPPTGDINLQYPITLTIEENEIAIEMDESQNMSRVHNSSSIILTSERKERNRTKREKFDNIQVQKAKNEVSLHPEENECNNKKVQNSKELIQKITVNDKACRICLESEIKVETTGELISPCQCTGTVKHVHEECLKKWIVSSRISIDKAKCELCNSKLLIEIDSKQFYCYKKKFNKRDYQGIGLIILFLILLYVLIHLMVIMIVQM